HCVPVGDASRWWALSCDRASRSVAPLVVFDSRRCCMEFRFPINKGAGPGGRRSSLVREKGDGKASYSAGIWLQVYVIGTLARRGIRLCSHKIITDTARTTTALARPRRQRSGYCVPR